MVTSTCAVAGPLPTMRRICRAESTGEFSQLPYLMAVWQGGLWVMYMLPVVPHVGEWTLMQPLAANAVNVCVNTIYNLIYIRHSRSRWRAAGRLAAVFAANGAISAFALIEAPTLPIPLWPNPSQTKQTTTLGIACTVLQVGMYGALRSLRIARESPRLRSPSTTRARTHIASLPLAPPPKHAAHIHPSPGAAAAAPLSIVHRVVRTRSVKYMPLAISVTCKLPTRDRTGPPRLTPPATTRPLLLTGPPTPVWNRGGQLWDVDSVRAPLEPSQRVHLDTQRAGLRALPRLAPHLPLLRALLGRGPLEGDHARERAGGGRTEQSSELAA